MPPNQAMTSPDLSRNEQAAAIVAKWRQVRGLPVDVSFPASANQQVVRTIVDAVRGEMYDIADVLESTEAQLLSERARADAAIEALKGLLDDAEQVAQASYRTARQRGKSVDKEWCRMAPDQFKWVLAARAVVNQEKP